MIRTSPGEGVTDAGYDNARPYEEKSFFGFIKDLFVPDEDRHTYAKGMRRGSVLLSVQADESQVDRACDIIEHASAVDLDQQEADWKRSGWSGYDASAYAAARQTMATDATTTPCTGQDYTIKVMQERLVVGKHVVEGGRVKIRAYVVERPVEAQGKLHQDSVHMERHPVNRPAAPGDMDAFREKTLEAHATSEEAVVGKGTRIVEEIGIHKEVVDRIETVCDTVHKTQVDVKDTSATARTGSTTSVAGGSGATAGRTAAGAVGSIAGATKGATGAVDRTLGINVSSANRAADAPDGTPGNPKARWLAAPWTRHSAPTSAARTRAAKLS